MPELKKILYADDEPDIREVVTLTLNAVGGFEVRACENGAEAVNEAASYRPDLILLDVMMPVMTGPEALAALRSDKSTADTPVIFITAKARAEEIDELTTHMRTGIVTKPFDPMALSQEVHAIWSRLIAE